MILESNELDDHILELKINRPKSRGALNKELVEEIISTLSGIMDNIPPRCIVLASEGTVFSAGADLKERKNMDHDDIRAWLKLLHQCMDTLENFQIPIIASLPGPALGGGFELAMACDFRIAVKNCFFQLPEVTLGIIPAGGGTIRLPQFVGKSKALEMILFNEKITADQAKEMGFLLSVAQDVDELKTQTLDYARRLAALPPLAVRAAKRALHGSFYQTLDTRTDFEIKQYEPCLLSKDRLEALKAFLEKRPPNFQGY